MNQYRRYRSAIGLVVFFCSIAQANYRIPSENTELVEDAMSGGAAIAIDASTNFFNPAGLTRIPTTQLVASGKAVQSNIHFIGTVAGVPGTANSHISGIAPAFHISTPLYNNFFFGFSMTSPFGSATKYPIGSIAQFVTTESSLSTIDLGPSLAYRFNPHFSLGGGPNVQYGHVVANVMFPPPPFPFNAQLKNSASDWTFGWHAGALYEFNAGTRAGINYRSQMRHRFTGTSSYPHLPNNDHLSITLPLPPVTTISLYHAFNCTWAMMATIDYTQWNVVRNIVVYESAVSPLLVVPQNFQNTVRYALGGEFHANPQVILRSGLSYEPTPMNNRDRSIILPVTDSIVFGIGGHYQAWRTIGFDVGYLHIFPKRAHINNTSAGVTTIGKAESTINALSAQLTWDIC